MYNLGMQFLYLLISLFDDFFLYICLIGDKGTNLFLENKQMVYFFSA